MATPFAQREVLARPVPSVLAEVFDGFSTVSGSALIVNYPAVRGRESILQGYAIDVQRCNTREGRGQAVKACQRSEIIGRLQRMGRESRVSYLPDNIAVLNEHFTIPIHTVALPQMLRH